MRVFLSLELFFDAQQFKNIFSGFFVCVFLFLNLAYIDLSEELLLGDASRSYFLYIRSPKEKKELKFECCSLVV